MSEPFTKDAERRARDSQTDTSAEAVERLIAAIPGVRPLNEIYSLQDDTIAMIRALAAERDALQAKLDELVARAVARAEVADEAFDKAIAASRDLIAKKKDKTDDQWRREIRGKANRGDKDGN